jgi:predicted RNA binding protein YcfA (HicA-like mRNA interferase family)
MLPLRHISGSMKRVFLVSEMLKILKDDGWIIDRQKGSHRQLKHPSKSGTITVSGNLKDAIHPKILKSILKQTGLQS